MRLLLGGWTFSGVTVATSGNPVNVTYSPDTLGLGGGTTNRPNFDRSLRSYPKKQLAWFNPAAYTSPGTTPWAGGPNQGYGTAGKDSMVGPGLYNWNLSLFKEFRITSGGGTAIPATRRVVQHLQSHAMECRQHRVHEQQLRTNHLDE